MVGRFSHNRYKWAGVIWIILRWVNDRGGSKSGLWLTPKCWLSLAWSHLPLRIFNLNHQFTLPEKQIYDSNLRRESLPTSSPRFQLQHCPVALIHLSYTCHAIWFHVKTVLKQRTTVNCIGSNKNIRRPLIKGWNCNVKKKIISCLRKCSCSEEKVSSNSTF